MMVGKTPANHPQGFKAVLGWAGQFHERFESVENFCWIREFTFVQPVSSRSWYDTDQWIAGLARHEAPLALIHMPAGVIQSAVGNVRLTELDFQASRSATLAASRREVGLTPTTDDARWLDFRPSEPGVCARQRR